MSFNEILLRTKPCNIAINDTTVFVVCGSLIQVCGYWGCHVLWGFVLCIEVIFCMPRGWRGEAVHPGAVDDGNDTTQA